MNNTYLLTGATGFIGSNIVRELIKQGEKVHIIVRDKKLNWRLEDIASQLTVHECGLLDARLHDVVKEINPEYIFHFAAYGIPPHEDNIFDMIDINLKGTANLIAAAKQNPFKLFINAGSGLEYGNKHTPMKETDLLEPLNDYAVVKSAATLYCQKEALRNNLPITTFRLFTPYGYYEDKYRLIPSVIRNAIANEPIKVSTPTSVRDFVFIEDVVLAYIQATKSTLPSGGIYNIGLGKQHTIGEVVELVLKLSGSKSEVAWGAVAQQKRYIEPLMLEADITKASTELGWIPRHNLEVGLEKTIEWFKANNSKYN